VTWVTSKSFKNLGFSRIYLDASRTLHVGFAVLIITDKISLYIPAIFNLYSILNINNVASNLGHAYWYGISLVLERLSVPVSLEVPS
jgi:hypothetical protein